MKIQQSIANIIIKYDGNHLKNHYFCKLNEKKQLIGLIFYFIKMQSQFPYTLLNKNELIAQMNHLAANGKAFVFIINYKANGGYLIEKDNIDEKFIQFDFSNASPLPSSTKIKWKIEAINFEKYKERVEFVKKQICLGNSFLCNFTQPTKVKSNLLLKQIYQNSCARYKLWFKNDFSTEFLTLSPETFIKIKGRKIASFPMKGTIDANLPNAAEQILNDKKESAEHATIVDLIRNDLSIVAENVEVTRYRYIDRIETNKGALLQVSSEICGDLPHNFHAHLGDIIFALLPAGSISGAPKQKTMWIIENAEGYERGFYTGICGHFDGKNLDSAVMIRFIEQKNGELTFKSGGGITAQSNIESEYQELIQKVYVPMS